MTEQTEPSSQNPGRVRADPALRRARGIFLAVTALYWISLYLYVPILAPYAEHQGGTLDLVGLVIAAYGVAQLLLRLPLGLMSDRLGRRRPFLAVGFLASVLAGIGFVYAPGPWFLVGARFVSGIAACAWVAFTVLFASYYPRGDTTRAMGYITFCNTLSVMTATAVGGRLADLYGWVAPFWASAAVSVLGLFAVAFVQEPRAARPPAQPVLDRFRSVVGYRELVLASTVAALGQYTNFATNFGFVSNYAVTIGASKTELGLLSMVSTLAGSVAVILSGTFFAPRFGARRSVVAGYLAATVAVAAIPYIVRVETLYLSQILAGFGRGGAYPILMGLAIARLPDADKATAMGFFQAVYAIGMSSGPIVAGMIGAEWGYPSLFLSSAGVGLVTALVALGLPGKNMTDARMRR